MTFLITFPSKDLPLSLSPAWKGQCLSSHVACGAMKGTPISIAFCCSALFFFCAMLYLYFFLQSVFWPCNQEVSFNGNFLIVDSRHDGHLFFDDFFFLSIHIQCERIPCFINHFPPKALQRRVGGLDDFHSEPYELVLEHIFELHVT